MGAGFEAKRVDAMNSASAIDEVALLAVFRQLALAAGTRIMEIYAQSEGDVVIKADGSPVTQADLAADAVICDGLAAAYPEIPVVTEERAEDPSMCDAARYFLVDPLDGTKEFVQRRGEFTVNIALIDAGRPIAGVVYAPAIEKLYLAGTTVGASEEQSGQSARRIHVAPADNAALRVVASKSHRDPATDAYIARYRVGDAKSAGSSLKFCMIASGEADLYPRMGPTMEWDTAAGHAVLVAAGGAVQQLPDGVSMQYGKPGRRNPAFVAYAPDVDLARS